jgi:hypothetical protein
MKAVIVASMLVLTALACTIPTRSSNAAGCPGNPVHCLPCIPPCIPLCVPWVCPDTAVCPRGYRYCPSIQTCYRTDLACPVCPRGYRYCLSIQTCYRNDLACPR